MCTGQSDCRPSSPRAAALDASRHRSRPPTRRMLRRESHHPLRAAVAPGASSAQTHPARGRHSQSERGSARAGDLRARVSGQYGDAGERCCTGQHSTARQKGGRDDWHPGLDAGRSPTAVARQSYAEPTRSWRVALRRISASPTGATSPDAFSGANHRVSRSDFSGHFRSCRSTANRNTETS
jgi:hypothetical protein